MRIRNILIIFIMNDLSKNTLNIQPKPKRVSPRKGRWSQDEKLKFKQGLAQFGRNWKKIQSFVRSRSLLQIRSHAQKFFIMQHKMEKRNKRWKRNSVKNEFDVKLEDKEDIFSHNEEEDLKPLNLVGDNTDCFQAVEQNSPDQLYNQYNYSAIPAFQYPANFQSILGPNIYCGIGPIGSTMPVTSPYSYPIGVPMPVIGLNPYSGLSGPLLNYPMNGFSGNFYY